MTEQEIRDEWCKMKGFNYIDFDTLKEAEEYILFLESRIEALNIAGVVISEERAESICDHPEDGRVWMRSGKASHCNKCDEMIKAK